VGGKTALCLSHLVDSSRNKLAQRDKGVWGKGGGVLIVQGRRIVGDPVLDEHVPSASPEGLVGFSHEIRWGDVCPRWGRGV